MPQAIPFITAGAAILGAANSAKAGKAAKNAAQMDADQARENAAIEVQNTSASLRQFDREQYLRMGQLRANQGKSGGTATSASFLDIVGDTAAQGEIERQNIRRRGELRERGFYDAADQSSLRGNYAASSAQLAAGSELLAGAANAYTQFQRVK
jgi:hypothetical protein